MTAADLWSLNQACAGDSDSARQSSSLTSAGVSSQVHADIRDTTDKELQNVHASEARPQRLNNYSSLDCQPTGVDEDACYRTLADSVSAGAYQIKLIDR